MMSRREADMGRRSPEMRRRETDMGRRSPEMRRRETDMGRRSPEMRGRDHDLRRREGDRGRDSRYPPSASRSDRIYGDDHRQGRYHDSPRRRGSRSPGRRREQDRLERSRGYESGGRRRSEEPRERRNSRERAPPTRLPPPDLEVGSLTRSQQTGPLESSRNDLYGSRGVNMAYSTNPGVGGAADVAASTGINAPASSSVNNYGMLVPRSIVVDGTVRTFFTLPPDPSSQPFDSGDGLKSSLSSIPHLPSSIVNPSFHEAIARYGTDPRQPSNDPVLVRGLLPGERAPPERVGGLVPLSSLEFQHGSVGPKLSSPSRRERPLSPYRGGSDHLLMRRLSPRSPGRERPSASFGENMFRREVAHPLPRERGMSPLGRRRFADGSDIPRRDRPISPLMDDPSRRGGPFPDPVVREARLGYRKAPGMEAPLRESIEDLRVIRRDGSVIYQSEGPPPISSLKEPPVPRGVPVGIQRDARMVPHMGDTMYGEARDMIMRARRSPRREVDTDPRSEAFFRRRAPVYRPGIEEYNSPRRAPYPNHRPPLEASDYYRVERGAMKRKYMERPEDFGEDGRLIYSDEPEFKRRGRERDPEYTYDDFPSRRFERRTPSPERFSRSDRSLGHRGSHGPDLEREEDFFRRHDFDRGARGEGGGSPLRFSGRDFYPRDDFDEYFDDREYFRFNANRSNKYLGDYPERSRQWWDGDMLPDRFLPGEEEQEIAPDLPEDSEEFKQQMQRAFLKFVKSLNEYPGQRKRYEDQGKAGTLLCLVCSRFSKPFVDTHSLLMHTYNSHKRGLRAEHLGLHKALCTLMGWSSTIEPDNGKTYQQIPPEEAKKNKDDLILWPPAVVVHNALTGKKSDGQHEGIGNPEMDELLKELGHTSGKAKAVYGKQGHRGTIIVKYLATFSGLQEAERLHQHFEANGRGRSNWLLVEPTLKEPGSGNVEEGPDLVREDATTKEKKRVLYGYLALAVDLEKVDLETRRRSLIRSRKEIEAIADDLKV